MKLGETIGQQLRYITAAVAFGVWMNSSPAAVFVYMAMITVEMK